MSNDQTIDQLADSARKASKTLRRSDILIRRKAVLAIANALENHQAEILRANQEDVAREKEAGLSESLIDRLLLDPKRILGIAEGARKVAALPDPLGKIIRTSKLPNGLELKQVSVPFGVVGMIYEARPNVTVDATVILLMSGNAAQKRSIA